MAEIGQALPVLYCHPLARPVLANPQADEALAEQDRVGGFENITVKSNDLRRGFNESSCEAALGFELDPRLPLAGLFGEALESLDRAWVEFAFEPREQFMPHAVAGEGIAGVRAVDETRLGELL